MTDTGKLSKYQILQELNFDFYEFLHFLKA